MKRLLALTLLVTLQCSSAVTETTVLPDVTVIDGVRDAPIYHVTVIIRGSTIAEVRRSIAASRDFPSARALHYEGHIVVPGIINGHGHLGLTDGVTSQPSDYNEQNIERQLKQYESYGVTTVMSLGLNTDLIYQLRDRQNNRQFGGATILTAGRGIGVPGGVPPLNVSSEQVYRPATAEEARRAVNEMADHHPNVIKTWVDDNLGKLPRPNFAVEAAAIDQAHKRGLRVAAHVFYLEDAKTLLRDGVDILAHSIRDKPVDAEFIQLMKQRKAFYIPTLQLEEAFVAYADQPEWMHSEFFFRALQPDLRKMLTSEAYVAKLKADPATEKHRQFLATAERNLKILSDAGIPIGFGTDSGAMPTRVQGFAEHRELQLMVDAGLTPVQALRSATSITAQMYGKANELGSIQPGRSADLLVLDGNPLANITATERILFILHKGVPVAPITRTALGSSQPIPEEGSPIRGLMRSRNALIWRHGVTSICAVPQELQRFRSPLLRPPGLNQSNPRA